MKTFEELYFKPQPGLQRLEASGYTIVPLFPLINVEYESFPQSKHNMPDIYLPYSQKNIPYPTLF